jgi:hypothetical protein
MLAKAVDVILSSGGVLDGILSSIAWATFGAYSAGDSTAMPRDAARSMVDSLGMDVRVIHGRAECLWGPVGSGSAFRHGMVLRDFGSYMSTLFGTEFGGIAEVNDPTSS